MPAKPLLSVKRNARVTMWEGAFRTYPELAALVAQVIADWAEVEMEIGTVLLSILGAEAKPAVAMYTALKSSQARAETLKAVARVTMPGSFARMVDAVLAYVSQGVAIRNQLAHGLWGTSEDIPNALLVIDADVMLIARRELTNTAYNGADAAIGGKWSRPLNERIQVIHPKNWFVYSKTELEEATKLMALCRDYVLKLMFLAIPNTVPAHPAFDVHRTEAIQQADHIYDWLCKQPQLQRYLNQSKAGRPGSA